jgi:hypothetical protein
MAKQTSDYKPTGFRIECSTFSNADGTTLKSLVVAGANDSVIVQMSVASLSSSDETLRLHLNDGTDDHLLCDVVVPAGSGTGSVPVMDIMALPFVYNASLALEAGWTLKAGAVSDVSVTGDVTVTAVITDY